MIYDAYLIGVLEHAFYDFVHSVGNFIIPTDELIFTPSFFRGVGIPPTSSYRWDFCRPTIW